MPLQTKITDKSHANLQEFQRYIISGIINALVSFIIYALCVELTPLPFWVANFFAMIGGIICGFILAGRYVFTSSKENHVKTLPKYILTIGIQFVVSTSLIAIFRQFGLSDILSYIFALPFVVLLSFGLQKIWVFQTLAKNN